MTRDLGSYTRPPLLSIPTFDVMFSNRVSCECHKRHKVRLVGDTYLPTARTQPSDVRQRADFAVARQTIMGRPIHP